MSAVTLESLRADFKAARLAVWACYEPPRDICRFGKAVNLTVAFAFLRHGGSKQLGRWSAEYEDDTFYVEECHLHRTAVLYTIARDHGIAAAMLYKLSDGNIDPRNEVKA